MLGAPKVVNLQPQGPLEPPKHVHLDLEDGTEFIGVLGLFSGQRKGGQEQRKLILSLEQTLESELGFQEHSILLRKRRHRGPDTSEEDEEQGGDTSSQDDS